MATQPISLVANYRWLTSYGNITSEAWSAIRSSTDGSTADVTFFILSQNMTDATQRDTVFAQIKSAISGYYTGVVFTTETHSWSTVTVGLNNYYQWSITLEGTATDPSLTGALFIAPTNFYVAITPNLAYGVVIGSAEASPCPECPPSVNPEDATDCLSCYEQYAVNCATPITIQGLDASTEYVITISDNVSGKNYSYTTTTDTNGEADIDTADFPTGLFSPYNSPFTLTITENGVPVTLTYGYVNYSCISLNITNTETA